MMPRLHLFEWEDQPWLPAAIRDFITDHLRYTSTEPMRREVNAGIAARLAGLLRLTGERRIVDLCSGGGGPIQDIVQALEQREGLTSEVLLTDIYPNRTAFQDIESRTAGRIVGRLAPTSATDVPEALRGVRTMFTAYHHFRPTLARQVLQDAVSKGAPIAIFEPLERSARMAFLLSFGSLVRSLTHTHRVGRLTPTRVLLTYLLPVAPLAFAWDGLVSVLRSYSPGELRDLAEGLEGAERYRFESGQFETSGPLGRMPTTYLLGWPVLAGEKQAPSP